jgi:uncharacterized protein (TIGR03084 family)
VGYWRVGGCVIVRGMGIFEDLEAEQERLEKILLGLDERQWLAASGCAGWTIADVVLHLAQSEEAVEATATHGQLRAGLGAVPGNTVEERADNAVRLERAAPAAVFGRWQRARAAALAALQAADPDQPVEWMVGTVKPGTLATTRLTEHWAHGLDIAGPLGAEFPDTGRLRHVAWLAHRTLPYALGLTGQAPVPVRCEVTAPGGGEVWGFGPAEAESVISGAAGEFCRVAVRRLDPARTGLRASGPHGVTALRALRTFAALRQRRAVSRPGGLLAGELREWRRRDRGARCSIGKMGSRLGHSRGSTGSDSRARTAKTHSCTRHSGSPQATRSRASRPRAYSRSASERLWDRPRWRSRVRLAGSV